TAATERVAGSGTPGWRWSLVSTSTWCPRSVRRAMTSWQEASYPPKWCGGYQLVRHRTRARPASPHSPVLLARGPTVSAREDRPDPPVLVARGAERGRADHPGD